MTIRVPGWIVLAVLLVATSISPAPARDANPRVPTYDVKASCESAREVSKDFQTDDDYQSCLADEKNARGQLMKVWPSYTARQKRECLEPGPDKSYVETLTCLQMDTTAQHNSDVGGPVAPGLGSK